MTRDRVIQSAAVAIAILAAAASTVVGMQLTAAAGRHKLTYADTAEAGDPPQVALGIAMGAFRGIFVNMLWLRANELKEAGRYHEANNLSKAITTLQPRFPRVWVFHAWNMSYNISVATKTRAERWEWVNKGIRLLREEAIPANPNDLLLHRELAWIYLHKVSGVTDDANPYYKRRLATEWHWILGEPPRASPFLSGRDETVEAFADWLTVIADAPQTISGCIQREREIIEAGIEAGTIARSTEPGLEQLLVALEDVDLRPGFAMLERIGFHEAVKRSALRQAYESNFGPRGRRIIEIMDDPAYEHAWPILLAHTRRNLLVNEFNMNPRRMIRYTRQFGPIDWRHPAAHAVYWSMRGIEESELAVTGTSQGDVDIINAQRIAIQSLQELYRFGEVFFDPLDFLQRGELGSYLALPNVHFVDSYGDTLRQLRDDAGVFERLSRAFTVYSAGYENFLQDVIRFLYRRGEVARAEHYYRELRTFSGQNLNDPMTEFIRSAPLEDFIQYQFREERFRTTYVATSEVYGALQSAFLIGLGQNAGELFQSNVEYAAAFHRQFMDENRVRMGVTGGVGRVEVMPADFDLLLGSTFAQVMGVVPLERAETMYTNAPESLRRYTYDALVSVYREQVNQLAERGVSEPFDVLFPMPSGMTQFRVDLQRRLDQRQRELNTDTQ